jgi:hypothetical protein
MPFSDRDQHFLLMIQSGIPVAFAGTQCTKPGFHVLQTIPLAVIDRILVSVPVKDFY